MHPSIEVNDLRKRYGRAVALDGMSFAALQPGRSGRNQMQPTRDAVEFRAATVEESAR